MPETWLEARELAEALRCSERYIAQLKADKVLKPGAHFYSLGKTISSCGRHVYCLERCRETLLQLTEQNAKARDKAIADVVTYDEEHLDQLTKETQAND